MKSKAYKTVTLLLEDNIHCLRSPLIYVPGIIDSLPHYGVIINSKSIQDFKLAITDFLETQYSCEVPFVNEESYNFWNNLSEISYKNPPQAIFDFNNA